MFLFFFIHGGGQLYYKPFAPIFSNFILSLALILFCLALLFFCISECFCLSLCFARVKMARQKTLESMFAPINKEEMKVFVEHDFDTLNTRLEVEKAMESEVVKQSVGRPKKDV
jgi:hypothetical protein